MSIYNPIWVHDNAKPHLGTSINQSLHCRATYLSRRSGLCSWQCTIWDVTVSIASIKLTKSRIEFGPVPSTGWWYNSIVWMWVALLRTAFYFIPVLPYFVADNSFQEFVNSPCMTEIKERSCFIHIDVPGHDENADKLPDRWERWGCGRLRSGQMGWYFGDSYENMSGQTIGRASTRNLSSAAADWLTDWLINVWSDVNICVCVSVCLSPKDVAK